MKKLFGMIVLVFLGGIMFSCNSYAMSADEVPGESVYSTDQDAIYDIILKSDKLMKNLEYDGITIVKESITPVYVADFLEYAKTGVFTIKPYVVDATGHEVEASANDKGNFYLAKTVNSEGLFAGNIQFQVMDGVAWNRGFIPTPVLEHYFDPEYGFGNNASLVSCSYADHAKRVQNLTNKDSLVPASEVRLVNVVHLGQVFYINDGKTEALVVIEADGSVFYGENGEVVYIGDELKQKADEKLVEYNEYLAYVEDFRAKYPDTPLPPGSGYIMTLVSADDETVDNIVNIADYLSIDNEGSGEPAHGSMIGIIAPASVLLLAFAVMILKIVKLRKAKLISKEKYNQ